MPDSTQAPAQAVPRKKLGDLIPPGSLRHFFLWREGSGGTYALLMGFLQWGIPLHLQGDWKWEMAFLAFFGSAVSGWYASAQSNAVQYAVRNEGSIDATQANRDYGWSVVPIYTIVLIYILTAIGLILNTFTSVFQDPGSWWIRDRLIISWPMLVYSIIAFGICRADLRNNNTVLSQFMQVAGRLMRFEHSS